MRARVLAALPLLIATSLYAFVTDSLVLALLVLGALPVALMAAKYLDAPRFVQRATLIVVVVFGAAGGATALTALIPDGSTRPTDFLGGLAVTVLMLATARRFFREPEGGPRFDFGLLTIAVVACGQKRIGAPYVAFAVLFVAAVIVMNRGRDPEAGWSVVERHSPRASLGLLVLVGVLSAVGMLGLPRLARLTQTQFDRYVIPKESARVGFTDRLRTTSDETLVESDELVLRVYGPHVDYLRGRVYDKYDRGTWENSRSLSPVQVETAIGMPPGPGVTEVRGVGSLAHPYANAYFFVPLGARDIGTTHGAALVDDLGALHPLAGEPATPIAFTVDAASPTSPERGSHQAAPEYSIAPPADADLQIPEALKAILQPLALEWTQGAVTSREKLLQLEQHLSHDFSYTLDALPPSQRPAIVDFLFRIRRGRCELFATGMALLARTVGVPTRVVGGFRVAEHNAVGGYDVVREKNAHAWVEGWDGASWSTFDPTPGTEANQRRDQRTASALGDAVLAVWDRALDLLARAKLWQFGVVLGGAISLLTLIRVLRGRRRQRASQTVVSATDGPLPCLVDLENALASRGHARSPSEPLEQYAERLRQAREDHAADVVLEYTALRYGGIGEAAVVTGKMAACTREINGNVEGRA